MPWRDKMGPASFRGTQFFVEVSELNTGRRGPDHQYAYRDDQYAEDMGGEGKTFPVEGYVVGEEYMAARDALLEQLDKKGPGELVHPYWGTLRVQVRSVRIRESARDGGMATFHIVFAKTLAEPAQPTNAVDGAAAVRTSAAAASSAVGAEFLSKYRALAGYGASVAGALTSAAAKLDRVVSSVQLSTQALASLKRSLNSVTANAASLALAPVDLLAQQAELVAATAAALVSSPLTNPVAALLKLYDFDPGVRPPALTPNRQIEQDNFDATQRLIQRLTLVQAATVAIEQTFESYDLAAFARLAITRLIDEQAEVAADDTYPALEQLRADLVKAVPGDAADLPRLLEYTPGYTVPSLVLAYDLYGNLAKESDLLARNTVRHAGFVAGGVTLEVLAAQTGDLEKLTDG